ncbi:MAG: lysophospholipid acyltransferase family protein [Bacteroidales bacterium]
MRAALHYLLIVPLAYLIAVLPFCVLRRLSSVLYFLLYHIIGYRKKTVRMNLRNAFPEKSVKERRQIEKRFYLHFTDIMLETLKMLTMSLKEAQKHIRIPPKSVALLKHYNQQGISTIVASGHYGCWEWGNYGYHAMINVEFRGIYHPLSDPYFEKLLYHMRTRYGSVPIKMKDTLRYMLENKERVSNTAFVADQSPSARGAYWTTFLNQQTGFFTGIEKIARKLKMPVLFVSIDKIKRNHYQMNFEVLVESPEDTEPGEITEAFVDKLEKRIREKPEYWLWSHRRWKHQKPTN